LKLPGWHWKLYYNHFGNVPVSVASKADPLDIVAAWTEDRKALTIGIVNPTEQKYEITMELNGAQLAGQGQLWQIANPDPMVYNEPGVPDRVKIEEKSVSGISNELDASAIEYKPL